MTVAREGARGRAARGHEAAPLVVEGRTRGAGQVQVQGRCVQSRGEGRDWLTVQGQGGDLLGKCTVYIVQCTVYSVQCTVDNFITIMNRLWGKLGLENPMMDPFVQLTTKHSSVELSW